MRYIHRNTITLLLAMWLVFCDATKRRIKLTKVPTEGNLDGLGCAIERHLDVRGVKFNTQTGACDALTDAWFTVQTTESDTNYYKLSVAERVIQPNSTVESEFPANFGIGSSVVMYIKTGPGANDDMMFNITNEDGRIVGYHVNVRLRADAIIFNAYLNSWGREERKGNPLTTPNNVYKLEFVLKQTAIDMKIDDSPFHSFNHRTSTTNYQRIEFMTTLPTLCQQLQYVYTG